MGLLLSAQNGEKRETVEGNDDLSAGREEKEEGMEMDGEVRSVACVRETSRLQDAASQYIHQTRSKSHPHHYSSKQGEKQR